MVRAPPFAQKPLHLPRRNLGSPGDLTWHAEGPSSQLWDTLGCDQWAVDWSTSVLTRPLAHSHVVETMSATARGPFRAPWTVPCSTQTKVQNQKMGNGNMG